MDSAVDRVYAELSTVLLKHPEMKVYLAEQTRSAAREMVLPLDAHRRWENREQGRNWSSISPNPLIFQAGGMIAPLPEPPRPNIIGEIRDRDLSDADQAFILTALFNSVVGKGQQIDPWDGIKKDAVDERAWVLFEGASYDAQGDGFGLDICGVESKNSPLLPGDEGTLLHFVSNLADSFSRSLPGGNSSTDKKKKWQRILVDAEKHLERNPWPGLKSLARLLKCSPATLTKAVHRSPKLAKAKSEYESRTESVTPRSNTASREGQLDPGYSQIDDRDELLHRLIEDCKTDEERARIHALSQVEQLRMATLAYGDPNDPVS